MVDGVCVADLGSQLAERTIDVDGGVGPGVVDDVPYKNGAGTWVVWRLDR
jgi:hypothetical protein